METNRGPRTLLVVAALGSLVSLLLAFLGSPNRSLAASRLDRPQDRSEPSAGLPLETASPLLQGRVVAEIPVELDPESAAGVDPLESDPERLVTRYEEAIGRYVRALDDCATREFEAGRFVTYDTGMSGPETGPDDIVSVRRVFDGRYRMARMSATDYPQLYRLRDDVLLLAEAVETGESLLEPPRRPTARRRALL